MWIALFQSMKRTRRGQSWRGGTRCVFPLEEMKYLLKFIFPFLRSGVEAKRGVEFCYSRTQCLQNSAESGDRSVSTLGSLCLPCCVRIQREADLTLNLILILKSGIEDNLCGCKLNGFLFDSRSWTSPLLGKHHVEFRHLTRNS